MKHISSKLILLTITLTSGLLLITAYLSFSILKNESRAYTLQGQLLQTQVFSETLKGSLGRLAEVAGDILELNPDSGGIGESLKTLLDKTKKSVPNLTGLGIYLESSGKWIYFPESTLPSTALVPRDQKFAHLSFTKADGSELEALFPAKNAVVSIRADLRKVLENCMGLNLVIYNSEGVPIFYCNPEGKSVFESSNSIISEIFSLKLESGTLERPVGNDSYIWTYSQVGAFGRIVSASTTKSAYRPAYALASRVAMLILMAIGAAIVASILVAKRLTGPIEEVTAATQRIANGEFDTRIDIKTRDETKTLADSVESMASKIKKLLISEVEKAKLDAQLEVAGAVQRTLIPGNHVEFETMKINSYYRPADQCGGDWWGYISDGTRLIVMIGDVSGHGYASALLVATTRGFLSMLDERLRREKTASLSAGEILKSLNGVVYDATRGELNMTAMCMIIELTTGEFEIASAGHNGAYQIKDNGQIENVRPSGPRLGETQVLSELPVSVTGTLNPTDKFVIYTDGIQDLGSAEHPLGRKGFKEFLAKRFSQSSEDLVKDVESVLFPMNEGRPLQDDLTFVVIERNA